MARESREQRRLKRATDAIAALDKAVRRGQRPDPLGAIDTYLGLDATLRRTHFDLVQPLVGAALDELGLHPPSNPVLTAWSPRLERAPELVQGKTEAPRVALERWWTLLRASLVAHLHPVALRLWPRLSAATSQAAPALARLIEAWLEPPAYEVSAERFEVVRPLLATTLAQDTIAVLAAGPTPDPRLGVEPLQRRDALSPTATVDDVRGWVETLFLQQAASSWRLRNVARGLPRALAVQVWAEAAPFLLCEALARNSAEYLRSFAEAVEAREPSGPCSDQAGGDGTLDPDLDTALRWSLAEVRASPSSAIGKLFPRLAHAAVKADARLGARVEKALLGQTPDGLPFTTDLVALLERLLGRPLPSAALWTWALAAIPGETEVRTAQLQAALEAQLPRLLEQPRALTGAFSQLSTKVRSNGIEAAAEYFATPLLADFLRRLWPEADTPLRHALVKVFEELVKRFDREEDKRARAASGARLSPLRPPFAAEDLEVLLAEGESAEDAVEILLDGLPPQMASMARKPLLELARRGPRGPSGAGCALWAELGPDIVAYASSALWDGLRYATETDAKMRLVKVALEGQTQLEDWLDLGHRVFQRGGPQLVPPMMDALAARFGDSEVTWQHAYLHQMACYCDYLAAIARRLLVAEQRRGGSPSDAAKKARRRFPAMAAELDREAKAARPAVKKAAAAKKAPGVKKAAAAKKAPAAKKQGGPR